MAGRTRREKSRTKPGLVPTRPAAWGAELGGISSPTARTIRFEAHIMSYSIAARRCPMKHLPRLPMVPHCNKVLFVSGVGCFFLSGDYIDISAVLFVFLSLFLLSTIPIFCPEVHEVPPIPPDPYTYLCFCPCFGVAHRVQHHQQSRTRVDSLLIPR